ncbi:MAG: 2OG-Fe(II) oxygenase [Bdellovibrionota bacterium]
MNLLKFIALIVAVGLCAARVSLAGVTPLSEADTRTESCADTVRGSNRKAARVLADYMRVTGTNAEQFAGHLGITAKTMSALLGPEPLELPELKDLARAMQHAPPPVEEPVNIFKQPLWEIVANVPPEKSARREDLTENGSVFTIHNLLLLEEAKALVGESETEGFDRATLHLPGADVVVEAIRNNYRRKFSSEALAKKLWERLRPHVPNQLGYYEVAGLNATFKCYSYENGQRFAPHEDGVVWDEEQRSFFTFHVYLNEGYEGGQTGFYLSGDPSPDLEVTGGTGNALLFFQEGMIHEGAAVTKGKKIRAAFRCHVPPSPARNRHPRSLRLLSV